MAVVSTQGMSIGSFRHFVVTMYSSITAAMPDTIAEKMKTTGINGEFHQGFALIEPKMKPTYPCNMKADGIPTSVTIQPTLWSIARARSLMLLEPSVIAR